MNLSTEADVVVGRTTMMMIFVFWPGAVVAAGAAQKEVVKARETGTPRPVSSIKVRVKVYVEFRCAAPDDIMVRDHLPLGCCDSGMEEVVSLRLAATSWRCRIRQV